MENKQTKKLPLTRDIVFKRVFSKEGNMAMWGCVSQEKKDMQKD